MPIKINEEADKLRQEIKVMDDSIKDLTRKILAKKIQAEIISGISLYGVIEGVGGKQMLSQLGMKQRKILTEDDLAKKREVNRINWERRKLRMSSHKDLLNKKSMKEKAEEVFDDEAVDTDNDG